MPKDEIPYFEWGAEETRKGKKGMSIYASYNAEFVEEIKELVPPEARDYDDDFQTWWVREDYVDQVNRLAESVYD